MGKLLYYVLVIPLSLLPHFVLYGLSDIFYLLVYRLIGYRKKVVRGNLKRSFPNKSEKEIIKIEKAFYHHLMDLGVESLKNFTISEKMAKKRFQVVNPELPDHYFRQGKSVILVGGHYNNWELLALALPPQIEHSTMALFTPLKNKFWNQKVTKSRSKYGLDMLPLTSVLDRLKDPNTRKQAVVFGSDQAPRNTQLVRFMQFLNQETAVAYGAERMARDFDMPILDGTIYKIKRGYYKVEFTLVSDDHSKFEKGEITEKFTKILERAIVKDPPYWLWSHKRWKRKTADHQGDRII
ncbi:MAG: lysophospholipid acyltransferase family protein [Bacteroidota bacterium]